MRAISCGCTRRPREWLKSAKSPARLNFLSHLESCKDQVRWHTFQTDWYSLSQIRGRPLWSLFDIRGSSAPTCVSHMKKEIYLKYIKIYKEKNIFHNTPNQAVLTNTAAGWWRRCGGEVAYFHFCLRVHTFGFPHFCPFAWAQDSTSGGFPPQPGCVIPLFQIVLLKHHLRIPQQRFFIQPKKCKTNSLLKSKY